MKALLIENVRKVYASGFMALKGINLAIDEGSFFGLLGPNGAGKTTIIGIITALVKKTSGHVQIFGHSMDKEPSLTKTLMGLVPQEFNFALFDRVIDIVVNQAGYYGISRRRATASAEYYLKALGLWDKAYQPARVLSGGMKRRLMIARALVHEPKMLILDEPTAGVDVELRHSMWDFLKKLNREGTTIILTTHYLEEIESLCDTLAIMNQGEIIQNGRLKDILSEQAQETIILELAKPLEAVPHLPGCITTLQGQGLLEIQFEKSAGLNAVFKALSDKAIQVRGLSNKSNRLEALLMRLVHANKQESLL